MFDVGVDLGRQVFEVRGLQGPIRTNLEDTRGAVQGMGEHRTFSNGGTWRKA